MAKRNAIGCVPVDLFTAVFGMEKPVEGSLQSKCQRCGSLVYIAPSSWGIIHDHPDIEIVCVPCLQAEAEELDIDFKDYNDAQMEEIKEYLSREEGD